MYLLNADARITKSAFTHVKFDMTFEDIDNSRASITELLIIYYNP